jgi:hypothetical protein
MKLAAMFFTILFLALLISAQDTAAQSSAPCNLYSSGSTPPAGFGASWNVLTSTKELLVSATCTGSDSATITAGSGRQNQYIYKTNYYYDDSAEAWRPQTFSGSAVGTTDWLVGTGTLTGKRPAHQLFLVAYVCQWTGSQWKCGCRDTACTQNYWQLQAIPAPNSLPSVEETEVASCTGPTRNVTPSTIQSTIDASSNVALSLAPGTYTRVIRIEDKPCVEIRCQVPAIVNGSPNPNGCVLTLQIFSSGKNLIVEDMVIKVDNSDAQNESADYGFRLYGDGTNRVRIAHNAFNGKMNHDISTKIRIAYIEVTDNLFVRCSRHCFEIGQQGNAPSKPSTSDTAIIRGNVFESPRINALTQRYNQNLIVENNQFRNVAGYAVINQLGNNASVDWDGDGAIRTDDAKRVPEPPLHTIIRNNTFTGSNKLKFEGRGVTDDSVLIRGNTGNISCSRASMSSPSTHTNEQTTAPPKLDPESDVSC